MKKQTKTLATCILEMAGVIFFRFHMQTPLPCGHMSENHVFFLPVNVHMVLRAGFFGYTVLITLVGIFLYW